MNYVFYDTETTGTSTAFSQILQFGAIRTDTELNELERFEIRSQLLPHIVPAPAAMWVTGISVKQLTDRSLPSHYQMVKAIKEKLKSWSPAIFLGYNSLKFDEQLLRQAFYQTLHPLYLTNQGGNSRIDVLRLLHAVSLFAPIALAFPLNEKGRYVFKLDMVAPMNGFAHEKAHDAMADVEATIHLCRLVRARAPELWASFIRFSNKALVTKYAFDEIVFSFSEYNYGKAGSWLVTAIGVHPDNNTTILAYDLANDPEEFVALSHEELTARLKLSPKPVRIIKSNACPILMPATAAPDMVQSKALGMDELHRRALALKANEGLRSRLIAAYAATFEAEEPSPHVEEQIYNGFFSSQEEKRIEAFHISAWEERLPLVSQFEDDRVKQLAKRLIYFERPDILSDTIRREHDIAIAKRLLGAEDDVPWLTLPKAIKEADDLISVAKAEDLPLLQEHRGYLVERLETASALVN